MGALQTAHCRSPLPPASDALAAMELALSLEQLNYTKLNALDRCAVGGVVFLACLRRRPHLALDRL